MIKMENLLDDDFENVAQNKVVYASFWRRVGAYLVDAVVFVAVLPVIFYNMIEWKSVPILISATLLPYLYKVFMEFKYGATLGKMARGILVTNYDFEKPNLSEVIMRNIIGIISGIFSIASMLYMFSLPEFKEVHSFMDYTVFAAKHTSSAITGITNLLSLVMMVDVLLLFGDDKKRTWHDKIGKTYVVERDSLK
jgi:uncharacterized RDD family membrane protein YckC